MEIINNAIDDTVNKSKTWLLSNISDIFTTLHVLGMNSQEQVIVEMEKYYEKIHSPESKKILSSLVRNTKENYLNKNASDRSMGEVLHDLEKMVNSIIRVVEGGADIRKRVDFSSEVKDYVKERKIKRDEENIINKIFDYNIMANYALKVYSDEGLYAQMQKRSINSYNSIESDQGKELLLKYISKEFLKIELNK